VIYLDNAATTRVDDRVVQAMLPYFTEHFGNPESVHCAADEPKKAICRATKQVERLLGSEGKGMVIFTSGGTESNNMVFRLLCDGPDRLCSRVFTSRTEHKSVLEPAEAARCVWLTYLIPGDQGYVSVSDLDHIEVSAGTLVSLMRENNETGMLNDSFEIGALCRRKGAFYHVDCVQSAGSIPMRVLEMKADLVSISSHKIHGPKGVGCLWISDRLLGCLSEGRGTVMMLGGGQQDGLRAGTMDVPGIVGFGEAAALTADYVERLAHHHADSTYELSRTFLESLRTECASLGVLFRMKFAANPHSDPKILAVTFPGADAETVVMMAAKRGLCVSNGAACNAVLSEPSDVLLNSGFSEEEARNTVRVSFSRMNTPRECTAGASILADTVKHVLSLNGS